MSVTFHPGGIGEGSTDSTVCLFDFWMIGHRVIIRFGFAVENIGLAVSGCRGETG
jgi:hypothetical protein